MGGMTIEKYRRGGFEKRVAKRRPDSIIIIMGGNDLDSKFDGYPYYCTEDVFSAMRDLILWFVKHTQARIVVMEVAARPSGTRHVTPQHFDFRRKKYNK